MPDSRNAGTSDSHVFCSACGTKNLAKHSFCSACGTRLVSPHNVPTLPMNVHQMQRASSPQYSEQFWRWFRQRHAALQIIGWLAFWWLLLPVLIWRTGWDTRLKLVLSAPFALCVIGALFGGPRDRRQMEQGLQQSVAVADTQPRGVPEVNTPVQESAAPTARPTVRPRKNTLAIPTQQAVMPAPPTAVPPTAVPPTATPLVPIAQASANGNIRSYPSTESGAVIGKVAAGETITLVSKTPDGAWYELTTAGGGKGYVSASLLDIAPGVSEIVSAKDAGPAPLVAKPAAKPAAKPGAQCDPNYRGTCIPNVDYDLDCGEVSAKDFEVVGADPHRFDRDRDGIACES